MLKSSLKTDDSLEPLFLRIALGSILFIHGAQKMVGAFGGAGFSRSANQIASALHLPMTAGALIIIAEFFGAIGIFTGFFTRISAVLVMASSIILLYINRTGGLLGKLTGPSTGNIEIYIFALAIGIALLIKGGGILSFDKHIGK